MRRAYVLGLVAIITSACAAPLELPDWTIPVPADTPAREFEVAALDMRGGDRIKVVEDLVIGGGETAANAAFYRARDLVVDGDGRILVLDGGNHRVQVFDAGGAFLQTFGGEGQGPGEFVQPAMIALAGEQVIINDVRLGRLSVWSLDGDHIADHSHGRAFAPATVNGAPGGTLYASNGEAREDGLAVQIVAQFTVAGEQVSTVLEVPMRGLVRILPGPNISAAYAEGFNGSGIFAASRRWPRFAVARDGALYLAAGDEYQVLALAPSGAPRWALRTNMAIPAFPPEQIDELVQVSDRAQSRGDFTWDESLPAIASVQVDGHGHLWVYPTDPHLETGLSGEGAVPEARPVDVYSSQGELLYSGTTDPIQWRVSFGDFVYAIVVETDSEEQTVVRYRLVEPF